MPDNRQSWSASIDDVPDWVRLTRERTASLSKTSEATVDRARRSGKLKWHTWNRRGVRIWSQDVRSWIKKGCPVIFLVALLGYTLFAHAACMAKEKRPPHGAPWAAVDGRKAPRHGIRWSTKSRR